MQVFFFKLIFKYLTIFIIFIRSSLKRENEDYKRIIKKKLSYNCLKFVEK